MTFVKIFIIVIPLWLMLSLFFYTGTNTIATACDLNGYEMKTEYGVMFVPYRVCIDYETNTIYATMSGYDKL